MNKGKIADTKPAVIELQPDTYYWCACGNSKNQPFCDGSHAGTEFTPKKFVIEKVSTVALCKCKQTGHAPFCDGTHKTLGQ